MKMPMPTPTPTPTAGNKRRAPTETRNLLSLAPVTNTVNLGPLPTDFVAPSSCSNWHIAGYFKGRGSDSDKTSQVYQLDVSDAPACMPTSYAEVYSKGSAPVFSLGQACPTGFHAACTMVASNGLDMSNLSEWDALKLGETAIGCCQPGFICDKDAAHRYLCVSTATLGQVVVGTNVFSSSITQTQTYTVDPTLAATAYAMQLIYIRQTGPLLADTATPAPSNPTTVAKPSATASSDDGLSAGTKAAIGIGVAVGVLLLVAAGWLISRRCVKRKRKEYSIREESVFLRTGDQSGAASRASARRYTEEEWVALHSKEASLKDNNSKKDWPLYGKPLDISGHVEVPGHDIPVELPAVVPSSWANKALPTVPVIPESPSKEQI